MHTTRILFLTLLIATALALPASAQPPAGQGRRTATWTVVGAGAGFGIGLWAGLTAFDDAIDSDRKVWTSAIVGAAIGGTLGYLLTRNRRQPATASASAGTGRKSARPPTSLTEMDVRGLAASARIKR